MNGTNSKRLQDYSEKPKRLRFSHLWCLLLFCTASVIVEKLKSNLLFLSSFLILKKRAS